MGYYRIVGLMLFFCSLLAAESVDKNWALSASMNNSVGIGTFVVGYSQTPSWTTGLTLNPSYKLPAFWGLEPITLSAIETANFWWLESYRTSATDFDTRIALTDLILDASMPKILKYESWGLSLGASFNWILPTSLMSQKISRIMAFGGSLPVRWSKMGFSVGWVPSLTGWIYAQPVISSPCFNMPASVVRSNNIEADASQFLQGLVITKSQDENLGDGQCIVSGRQTTMSLSNMFSLGWSNKVHTVNMGLGWFINFLRPLADRPDLRGEYATGQNFTEATLGRVAYSYKIPIETDLSVGTGVMSIQASYDRTGNLAFPFFDFTTPSNNQTQIFVQATIGI